VSSSPATRWRASQAALESSSVRSPGNHFRRWAAASSDAEVSGGCADRGHPLATAPRGITEQASRLGDRSWRALLDAHHVLLRADLERFGGRKVATTGDGLFATLPVPPVRSAVCAMRDAVHSLGLEIRVGLHTGEVETVGADRRGWRSISGRGWRPRWPRSVAATHLSEEAASVPLAFVADPMPRPASGLAHDRRRVLNSNGGSDVPRSLPQEGRTSLRKAPDRREIPARTQPLLVGHAVDLATGQPPPRTMAVQTHTSAGPGRSRHPETDSSSSSTLWTA
jgi:hypothetical protein